MAEIEINDLASVGLIRDIEPHQLPPEAFTEASNMRFFNQGVETIGGRAQVFGTPTVAPHFALPIANMSQTYWLYASLTKVYVFDGVNHTNITRQTASVDVDYTATQTRDWNGMVFGGVPVLNNGQDVPQYWATLSTGTKLAALPNWTSTLRARILRSLGPHMIAFNLTDNGTVYPHLVQWSHPADPGSVPASWDYTSATYDAGRKDLPDVNAGVIQEALPLAGKMFIYKDNSTWRMSFIGGQFIFDFQTFLETSGILGPRCVAVTGDGQRHVVATQDDIIIHNGTSAQSILTERYKKYLFNQIDTDNYQNSFMFANPAYNEIWFCYPEPGQTNPTRALIWNYSGGKLGAFSEASVNFRNVALGVIETASDYTWETIPTAWDSVDAPWSEASRRKLLACNTDATELHLLDSGSTFNGTSISSVLTRTALGVVGRKRTGEWIVDFMKMKFISRLWIKASGGPINVRVGMAETPQGSVTWSLAQTFDPTTQLFLDFETTGRAIAVEFTASRPFRIEGYTLQGDVTGGF